MNKSTQHKWDKVKAIFEAATELPSDEQNTYINAACDDVWTKSEVQRLLLAEVAGSNFLEKSVVSQIEKSFDLTGLQIGSYKVIRELGRGGMSKVYLAEHIDGELRKLVAIKVLWPELHNTALINLFHHEFQLSSRLDHPNISRLFDHGVTNKGLYYSVIEYIDGIPITKHCDKFGISITGRLQLFLTVCQAVQHAHLHQIIHLDLKPANILVTNDQVPKLIDFGIAKILSPEAPDQTSTGILSMTPDYASPEQILGGEVTVSSDVYSLGVILYELTVGRKPFNLKSKTLKEITHIICEQEPPKPSESGLHVNNNPNDSISLNNMQLMDSLDAITLKALQKAPSQRYSSVDDLYEAVQIAMKDIIHRT